MGSATTYQALSMAKTTKSLGGRPTAERAAEIAGIVLDATIMAFVEHGSDFSMDQVAKLAGVSKQAIYRRWMSKFDLLVDAISNGLARMTEERDQIAIDNPLDALRQVSWERLSGDLYMGSRLGTFLQAEGFRNETIREHLVKWRAKLLGVYVRRLEDLERIGMRAEGDIEAQAAMLDDLLSTATTNLVLLGTLSEGDRSREFEQRWQAFCRFAIK